MNSKEEAMKFTKEIRDQIRVSTNKNPAQGWTGTKHLANLSQQT